MTETAIAILPKSANPATWSGEQTALMKSIGLQGVKKQKRGNQWVDVPFEAPADIVQAFLYQIERTGLDPVARQIYCIERGGKWGIQASIDGFRLVAERTGQYAGQTPVQWTGDGVTWVDVWLKQEPPAAARIGIYRKGFSEPIWAVATYSGYVPRDRDGNPKPTGQWAVNSPNQLAKCAEMLGLRKAFPQDLSGIYGTEEMDQASPAPAAARAEVKAEKPAPAPQELREEPKPSRDWVALANECRTVEDLRALDQLAEGAGERGLKLPIDGTPSVGQYIRFRANQVAQQQEPAADEPVDAEVVEDGEPTASWAAREPGSGLPAADPEDAF